ncbi:MAG: TAT-variant-translocated molybdopterin oxidoreductase [Bacteroidota bacterium]
MSTPKYWRGLEEKEQSKAFLAEASKEFPQSISLEDTLANTKDESLDTSSNRRDFLKVLGFGLSAAALAACTEGPIKQAVPYVDKPDDLIPGVPNFYASTTPSGEPVIVKTREGRPIKLEGNPDTPLSNGGSSGSSQASVLDLYDIDRLQGPQKGENLSDWDTINKEVAQKLAAIEASGGGIRILSESILSPSLKAVAGEFLGQYTNGGHVSYDPSSLSSVAKAHEIAFGRKAMPSYDFAKAMTIVSFSCDFLGTWQNSVETSAAYVVNRDPKKEMSRHIQVESLMSTTGANADLRLPVNPSQEGVALMNLYNKVAAKLGRKAIVGVPAFNLAGNLLDTAADDLVAKRGASLVVCGNNDLAQQLIVAGLNEMLGNYGSTLSIANASYYKQGDDEAFGQLVEDIKSGAVKGLLVLDADPIYNSPHSAALKEAMSQLDLSVAFTTKANETSRLCQYTAATPHYLEAWGDAQQMDTHYSLVQPTIHPLFDTRQVGDVLLKWSGSSDRFIDRIKANWEANMLPQQSKYADFRAFWNESLRAGVFTLENTGAEPEFLATDEQMMAQANQLKSGFSLEMPEGQFDLVFYESTAMKDGRQANNPWLQELPDPVTKVTWDNYVTVPYSYAKANGIKNEDVLKLEIGGESLYMPALVQPGQALNTLGIALGYGRQGAGRVADKANGETRGDMQIAGANGFAFSSYANQEVSYVANGVTASKIGQTYPLALTQEFNTLYDPVKGVIVGDDYDRTERIIEETTTAEWKDGTYKDRVKAREERKSHLVTLWDTHFEDPETSRNIHWKMAIDLNKCTGCGDCIVACQAENNIPVVGKNEVKMRRGMYWLRIDRYYSGEADNPDVVFQPMLCQHCDNAPCETVCPVLATIHSNEGLNQMTYNRCVGTRYCANNCPYKVRRFNWFNYWNDSDNFGDFYTHNDLGRLVLNPDVTVRFRGVMEKCSFCVQRLQEGKLKAKVNAKSTFAKPEDGSVKTACQQACATGAIVFGDFNDPNSEVNKAYRDMRSYAVLEDIKVLPSVQYQALVRNRTAQETAEYANDPKNIES